MDWFRLDHRFISNPKVGRLTREMRSYLVDMWCVSSSQRVRGTIPSAEDMAFHWRVKPARARQVMAKLIAAGFVVEDPATKELTVHDWEDWQKPSDDAGAVKRAQRDKKKTKTVHGQSKDSPPLDTDTDREKENTPLRPPSPGGRHALVTVVDSGEPDPASRPDLSAPGSPEYRAVLAKIPDGWNPQAEAKAVQLLSRLPAKAVLYGLEETLEKNPAGFSRKAAGYWQAVAEDNPNGRPAPALRRWQPRPEGPPPNPEMYEVYRARRTADVAVI